jgi:hypothetical protein
MVQRVDLATLLVDDLQRVPFQADGWTRFATRLCKALHGPVVLGTVEIPSAKPIKSQSVLIEDAAMAEYRQYYYGISPWREWNAAAAQGSVAGGAAVNSLSPKEYETNEFYADFLRPNRMHHGMCARIRRTGTEATDLAILRPQNKGPMTLREISLVRGLMPQMRRALRVRQLLGDADLMSRGLLRAEVGVLLVDRTGRVLFASPAAYERLAESDGVTTARGGVLAPTCPSAQKRLRALVRYAVDGAGPFALRGGGDMLLPRPGRPPLRVTITGTPHGGETAGVFAPAAMLLLREPPPPPAPLPVFRRFDRGNAPSEVAGE